MPPLFDSAMCEYPPELNASALHFERKEDASEGSSSSTPPPEEPREEEEEEEEPPPAMRRTRAMLLREAADPDPKMEARRKKQTEMKKKKQQAAKKKKKPPRSTCTNVCGDDANIDSKDDANAAAELLPCASSILGDDLILCRLSSLLPPADYDNFARSSSGGSGSGSRRRAASSSIRRPQLVRKVSTSDVSMDEFDSCDSDEEDTSASSSSASSATRRRGRRTSSSSASSSGGSSRSGSGGSGSGFSLIPGDVAVVLPPELRHPDEIPSSSKGGNSSNTNADDGPLQHLLRAVGVEEVEALDPTNDGPAAGQCQFACVASALSRSFGTACPIRGQYRPDLELRRLALHVIRMNPDLYRNFLTVAGGRTRTHSQAGGASVDMDAYLRTMSNPSCDGDAVTLQALCDALKITVRIVKPVTADSYDEDRQKRLLNEYFAQPNRNAASASAAASEASSSSTSSPPDASSDEEYATAVEDDDDASSTTSASSLASAYSTLSWSDNPYSSCTRINHVHHIHTSTAAGNSSATVPVRQRLYVSQEIRPRRLARIDTRIRDVQKVSRGRLIWLSHIGDEAHYRFLRPLSMSSCATASNCPHGPVNEEEAVIARRSQEQRRRRLDDLLSSREDGYVRPYKAQVNGRARSASQDAKAEDFDIVSSDKLLRLKKVCHEPSQSPRCGLCFQGFFAGGGSGASTAAATSTTSSSSSSAIATTATITTTTTSSASPSSLSSPVSPSGCDHDFCRPCIQAWSTNVSPTCPTCGCQFMDLIDQNQRVVTSRSVTPPIEDDISDLDIPNESSPSTSSKKGSTQHVAPLTPPDLPPSFSWAAALAAPEKGDTSAVSAFNRQMLSEVGHELRLGVPMTATNAVVLIRFMGQLATMVDGPQLRSLLSANVLRTLRLLLTPSTTKSTVRSISVAIPGDSKKRYVPGGDIFRAALAIIERINLKCSITGGGSMLTMAMLRDSLDLPKLMLWYVSCPEVKDIQGYAEGLGCARRVLASLSKQHCLSIVQALQKCGSLEAAEKKLEASRKRARAAAAAAANPTKKPRTTKSKPITAAKPKVVVKKAPPAGPPKSPVVRVMPKIPPPKPILRGAGKRAIRPVVCVNISREEMSLRQYRQE